MVDVEQPAVDAELERFDALIDARSPAEFAEDRIPGAVNCPVLDNAERIRIGTLYKEQGAFEAKKAGVYLVDVRPKILEIQGKSR